MSHPTFRGTLLCTYHKWTIPRDLDIGHDPSLGDPIPGQHRVCRWSKPTALRFFVTGSQTQNCFLPSYCHITQRRNIELYCNAGQTMSLFATIALPCTSASALLQRSIATSMKAQRRWTSQIPSVYEQLKTLCDTSSAMTRADLLSPILIGTETFVSSAPKQTTAATRFKNFR